jgi:hypothetical protein
MKLLKNTRKKVVTLAVASALGGVAMMSAPAHAINVANDGKGEVLLFPYYTVKNGFDTILSVVNTSDRTALFKIRFREALNSREVRDFNVALSPHDVWTAGVTVDSTGSGAVVRTFDKSCTSPPLPAGAIGGSTEKEFTSIGYDGTDAAYPYDNGGKGLSRVQEGYIEIIEMAISTIPESNITSANTIEFNTKHVSGVPTNCAVFNDAFKVAANLTNGAAGSGVFSTFTAPANVLVGNATIINVAKGIAIDATPTAIQSFADTNTIIFVPGGDLPTLAEGDNLTANFIVDGAPVQRAVSPADVAPSVDAVSTVLMAGSIINEYASGGTETSGAKTDWIVTFPTKHYYTDGLGSITTVAFPPFTEAFTPRGSSCDAISVAIYDREEKTIRKVADNDFSPVPTGPGGVKLCSEVNVVTFTNSADALPVVGSGVNQLKVNTAAAGSSGWANLAFTETNATLQGFLGLPVIGFSAISRENSVDAGNNRNYGSGSEHARNVVTAPAP